ncbi:MAG: energy-coupling factor ABC transporter permease [Nitrospinae bacterium]|nr:energy-coupling factor ABC transporter permease [Nitrospinota bacterium]
MNTTTTIKTAWFVLLTAAGAVTLLPSDAYAMHISDGILPPVWAAFWWVAAVPFVAMGLKVYKERSAADPSAKPFVALIGAAVFVVSCMPIPVPIAGTTAHPCGTGLAAILIGPWLTILISSIALALQALFLAHGGVTTLGANIFSMGIVGSITGYGAFKLMKAFGASTWAAAFAAGLISDWGTYATTSFHMALALHGDSSMFHMFLAVGAAFVPTQVPLGILEGFLAAGAYQFITVRRPALLTMFSAGRSA